MSTASYISSYTKHLGFRKKPAEWGCRRCAIIIRKKKKDSPTCHWLEHRQDQIRTRSSRLQIIRELWDECKPITGSLLLSGPSGLALALEPLYSLPIGVLIPALFAVQIMSMLLVSSLHNKWYRDALSSGFEMPLMSYILQFLAIFIFRFYSWQLGLSNDSLMQALDKYQETWYDKNWPNWRKYQMSAAVGSCALAALVSGVLFWAAIDAELESSNEGSPGPSSPQNTTDSGSELSTEDVPGRRRRPDSVFEISDSLKHSVPHRRHTDSSSLSRLKASFEFKSSNTRL